MFYKLIKFGVIASTLGCGLLILTGFLNSLHPAFDTISNFRYHAAIGCLVLALLWLSKKHLIIALVSAALSALGFYNAAIGLALPLNTTISHSSKIYSAMVFNAKFDNPKRKEVLQLIEKADPDIFIGIELNGVWNKQLDALGKRYETLFHCDEHDGEDGFYLYAKFPITQKATYCHHYAAIGLQQLTIDGTPVTIGGVHLRWPWPASQPEQLERITPALKTLDNNALILGDFNASTWTHAISSFAENGKLEVFPHIGLTWLDLRFPDFLRRWVGLPLDNAMSKGAVKIIGAEVLPNTGSDHLPVLVRFTLQK